MKSPVPAWCYQCGSFILNGSRSGFLCRDCYGKLPWFDSSVCPKCGKSHHQSLCTIDWANQITIFHALFPYQDPIRKWISSLKYSRNFVVGRLLQNIFQDWMEGHSEQLQVIDYIVPVPLHFSRLNSRGLNQSVYLLNSWRHEPRLEKLVRKARKTEQQAGKSKKGRESNLKGVFQVIDEVKGKNLLLFDDVCTTGQTLAEISKTLIKAGANRVDALVLCRNI